jgi:hypothetical protein
VLIMTLAGVLTLGVGAPPVPVQAYGGAGGTAVETIRGFVRSNSEPFCGSACSGYFLEDGDGLFLAWLNGSYFNYTGLEIEITGYRAGCGGCTSFFRTSPVTIIVAVEEPPEALPRGFALRSYPNPFNPSTAVVVDLPRAGAVRLSVWNVAGEQVALLHAGELPAGRHEFTWNAAGAPSGVYLARLDAGEAAAGPGPIARLLLLR